jgi:hypothetical protein
MNFNKLLLTGGIEKPEKNEEWSGFQIGIALELDVRTGNCHRVIEYFSPASNRPSEPDCSVLFKSGDIQNNELVVTTQTEVLIYTLPQYDLERCYSLKEFNDVHHAKKLANGNLLVCTTGLDAVFEINQAGDIVDQWSTIEDDIWSKFSKSEDYRKILTTKPHSSHPNFCFDFQDEKFVTRFQQKDAISLTGNKRFDIGVGGPHDGFVLGNEVYFTTVNGFVVGFNIETTEKILVEDLNNYEENKKRNLGWCRSLLMCNKDEAIVGFSRIRTTKFSDYLSWVKEKTGAGTTNAFPTRIVKYNLKNNVIDWSVNIENFDMNAVFSILPLD